MVKEITTADKSVAETQTKKSQSSTNNRIIFPENMFTLKSSQLPLFATRESIIYNSSKR